MLNAQIRKAGKFIGAPQAHSLPYEQRVSSDAAGRRQSGPRAARTALRRPGGTMNTRTLKTHDPKASTQVESYASEADFDDTIAQNRALPILDPDAIPGRP